MITGKNYIGNVLASTGDVTFKTFNPLANSENKTVFTEAAAIEIETAVELATEAYKTYSKTSGEEKSNFLNEIANQIEKLGSELIDTYCSESGLTKARAMGERSRTLFQLRTFANLVKKGSWVKASIDTAISNRKPMPKPDIRKMNIPLGPVVVFGASNFPLAYSTAGGDTASALAAGCPVLVKSHPMHAGTGELVASAIIKAAEKTNMPNGVFSNLNSSGIEVGIQLVKHPQVKAVGFTGSLQGGRALYNLAAQRAEPIPVFAEMGSINPVVILPNALKLKGAFWAKTYAGSITLGSGQFCTNPGLLIAVECDALTEFTNKLANEILKIEPSCMLHPAIKGSFDSNKKTMQQQSGVLTQANYDTKVQPNVGTQAICQVKGETFLNNPMLHKEVFGPFSMVVACKNAEELEAVIANLEGQLTGTVISEDNEIKNYGTVVSALQGRVGRLIFNGVPTGVEVCDSMVHGGPYPASTDSRFTAVGTNSIYRWVRPVSFQNWPDELLPPELQNNNPLQIERDIDGVRTKKNIE